MLASVSKTPQKAAVDFSSENEFTDNTKFFEKSFFSMPSRGTVYSFVPLRTSNNEAKILIASLEKVYCLESSGAPSLVEVFLPSTPQRVQIASMDAFKTSDEDSDYVIGITFVKTEEATQSDENSFKVFNGWDFSSEQKFQNISQNSFSSKLDFMPYKLYHAKVGCSPDDETVWLLAGSDCKVHLYHFDDKSLSEETSASIIFPEFSSHLGLILDIQIQYSQISKKRTTVVAGELGSVHIYEVSVADAAHPIIMQSRSLQWDYPVVGLSFFSISTHYTVPSLLNKDEIGIQKCSQKSKDYELLICNSLEGCHHLRDFFNGECRLLPESASKDVITCCIARDIDFDGQNEILVGTFGQIIFIYKQDSDGCWKLVGSIMLPSPVISMAYEDVAGDGICSLVVMTFGGVHIYEHEQTNAIDKLMRRLDLLVASPNL